MILHLLACGGGPAPEAACVPGPAWPVVAEALTACGSCHPALAPSLGSADDLRPYADVLPALLDDPTHAPPLDAGDAAVVTAWAACPTDGAALADPCDGPAWPGDVGPGDQPCAEGFVRVDGDLVLGTGSTGVGCLCAVGGDLVLGADTRLPSLATVDGTVRAADGAVHVVLPALREVGGLDPNGGTTLVTLDLPVLERLPGPLELSATGLTDVALPHVTALEALEAVGALNLRRLDTARLVEVAGDVRLMDLPYLEEWTGAPVLAHVGGDLELAELPSWAHTPPFAVAHVGGNLAVHGTDLTAIDGFDDLIEVPGELSLTLHRRVTRIDGFRSLRRVGEALRISANDNLERITGFDALTEVGLDGDVADETDQLRIAFDFALAEVDAFGAVERVGSLVVTGNDTLGTLDLPALTAVDDTLALRACGFTRLDGFGALTAAPHLEVTGHPLLEAVGGFGALGRSGDVRVAESPLLRRISGFEALTTVDGDLGLERLIALTDVSGLAALTRVTGDLTIVGTPALDDATIDALLDAVQVDGAVVRD